MDITHTIRDARPDPGAVPLQAVIQPQFGKSISTTLTVGSDDVLRIPQDVAKAARRNGSTVTVATEIDPATLTTFRAKVSSDGTVHPVPGAAAMVAKANVVGQPTRGVKFFDHGTRVPSGLLNSSAPLPGVDTKPYYREIDFGSGAELKKTAREARRERKLDDLLGV